jgi:hypothetical protein
MLQYHLDEPTQAEKAWETLYRQRKVSTEYDNPASIAELTRSLAAAHIARSTLCPDCNLIAGFITVSYTQPNLLKGVEQYLANTAGYLAKCGIPIKGYAITIISPCSLDEKGIPTKITLNCLGNSCNILGLAKPKHIDLAWKQCNRNLVLGCNQCKYSKYCIHEGLLKSCHYPNSGL